MPRWCFSHCRASTNYVCLSSLASVVVSALGGIGNNAGVGSKGMFGLRERVGVRGHELAFVVGASVTNDNLGGVLVGHNNGRGR